MACNTGRFSSPPQFLFFDDRFGRPGLAVGRRRRKEAISVATGVVTPEA